MNRFPRTVARSVVCAVVVVLGAAGCGVALEEEPQTISSDDLPEPLRPAAGVSAGPSHEPVTVWLVDERQDEQRLVSTTHGVESPVTALAALQALGSGPTDGEQDSGLRSAIPGVEVVLDATVAGGTATVELTERFDQIPAVDQLLAIGQMVLTLTDLRGVGQVRFVRAGIPIAVPLPGGRTTEGLVSADEFRDLVAL